MCGAASQVIGPLFQLLDTNAAASASVPGFDAGVFKSLTVPNPPVRPALRHLLCISDLFACP